MGEEMCQGYIINFGKVLYQNLLYFVLKPEILCTKLRACSFKKVHLSFNEFAETVLNSKIPEK